MTATLMVMMIMSISADHMDYRLVKAENHIPIMKCEQMAYDSNIQNPLVVGNYTSTCAPEWTNPRDATMAR